MVAKHLPGFLIAGLLLGGQALACLAPSLPEIDPNQAMACCQSSCRFDPTSADPRTACQQSRAASLQESALSSPMQSDIVASLGDLASPVFLSGDPHLQTWPAGARLTDEGLAAPRHGPEKLYLFTHLLLI